MALRKKRKPTGPRRRLVQRLFGAARERHNRTGRRMSAAEAEQWNDYFRSRGDRTRFKAGKRVNPPMDARERRSAAWRGRVRRAGIEDGRIGDRRQGKEKRIKKGLTRLWSLRRNNVTRDPSSGRFKRR